MNARRKIAMLSIEDSCLIIMGNQAEHPGPKVVLECAKKILRILIG